MVLTDLHLPETFLQNHLTIKKYFLYLQSLKQNEITSYKQWQIINHP